MVVVEDNSRIGHKSGSSGTATVTGANSRWTNSGWLSVGDAGTGVLNVESGGLVVVEDKSMDRL